jgi:hypothetical protein
MPVAQSPSMPRLRCLSVIMTRWHRLLSIARNPYRPELHYMRGPGPKSHAKHQSRLAPTTGSAQDIS